MSSASSRPSALIRSANSAADGSMWGKRRPAVADGVEIEEDGARDVRRGVLGGGVAAAVREVPGGVHHAEPRAARAARPSHSVETSALVAPTGGSLMG